MSTNNNSIETISTEKVMPKQKSDKKCAPGVRFDSGSCITLPVLVAMAEAYNKVNKNKITLYPKDETIRTSKYKKYLLKEIGDRYKNVCDSQFCWSQQDFIKNMNELMRIELEKFTLRPSGPEGRFEWLNTVNINEVMEQYQKTHEDFLFLGAVPIDFEEINLPASKIDFADCEKDGITKFGIVFNLDKHNQSGSHWTSMFADMKKGEVYYFDSYGSPVPKRLQSFMQKFVKYYEQKYNKECVADRNKMRHQYGNSECGLYSINFILKLLNGEHFNTLTNNKITDDEVNKLRTIFFRNVEF
jgi:hypothetical protein